MMGLKRAVLALVVVFAPAWAMAQQSAIDPYYKALLSQLHPEDVGAMEGWEEAMRAHFSDLKASGALDAASQEAAVEMIALLDLARLPITRDEMIGDWSFKSYQTDSLGAFAYTFFNGRIYPEGEALVLDKSGGSQRHFGYLAQAREDALFFAGALSYSYDPRPRLYSSMEANPDGESRERDATAEIYKIGDGRYLMVFAPDNGRFRLYEIVPR